MRPRRMFDALREIEMQVQRSRWGVVCPLRKPSPPMKKAFFTLFFATSLTLSAQTTTTRSVDLIDPAAFGFVRPG